MPDNLERPVLDVTAFHTFELERIAQAEHTEPKVREAILMELDARAAGLSWDPSAGPQAPRTTGTVPAMDMEFLRFLQLDPPSQGVH